MLRSRILFSLGFGLVALFLVFASGAYAQIRRVPFEYTIDESNRPACEAVPIESGCPPLSLDLRQCNNGPSISDPGNCGGEACQKGELWTKYELQCKQVRRGLCDWKWIPGEKIRSNADKCILGETGLRPGYCDASSGAYYGEEPYKFCCAAETGDVGGACVAPDQFQDPFFPDEGVCPSGTVTSFTPCAPSQNTVSVNALSPKSGGNVAVPYRTSEPSVPVNATSSTVTTRLNSLTLTLPSAEFSLGNNILHRFLRWEVQDASPQTTTAPELTTSITFTSATRSAVATAYLEPECSIALSAQTMSGASVPATMTTSLGTGVGSFAQTTFQTYDGTFSLSTSPSVSSFHFLRWDIDGVTRETPRTSISLCTNPSTLVRSATAYYEPVVTNTPPTTILDCPGEVVERADYWVEYSASDVEGDPLTFTISGGSAIPGVSPPAETSAPGAKPSYRKERRAYTGGSVGSGVIHTLSVSDGKHEVPKTCRTQFVPKDDFAPTISLVVSELPRTTPGVFPYRITYTAQDDGGDTVAGMVNETGSSRREDFLEKARAARIATYRGEYALSTLCTGARYQAYAVEVKPSPRASGIRVHDVWLSDGVCKPPPTLCRPGDGCTIIGGGPALPPGIPPGDDLIDPSALSFSISADPSRVLQRETTRISWASRNASSCLGWSDIDSGWNTATLSGSETRTIYATTSYYLVCTKSGTATRNISTAKKVVVTAELPASGEARFPITASPVSVRGTAGFSDGSSTTFTTPQILSKIPSRLAWPNPYEYTPGVSYDFRSLSLDYLGLGKQVDSVWLSTMPVSLRGGVSPVSAHAQYTSACSGEECPAPIPPPPGGGPPPSGERPPGGIIFGPPPTPSQPGLFVTITANSGSKDACVPQRAGERRAEISWSAQAQDGCSGKGKSLISSDPISCTAAGGWSGGESTSGTRSFPLDRTTEYSLTCSRTYTCGIRVCPKKAPCFWTNISTHPETQTDRARVRVVQKPRILDLTSDPKEILLNKYATISWQTESDADLYGSSYVPANNISCEPYVISGDLMVRGGKWTWGIATTMRGALAKMHVSGLTMPAKKVLQDLVTRRALDPKRTTTFGLVCRNTDTLGDSACYDDSESKEVMTTVYGSGVREEIPREGP